MAALNDLVIMLELSASLAKSVFASKDFCLNLEPDLTLSGRRKSGYDIWLF